MRATLTIAGLYNYDNSIFDNLKLPPGVNHDTAVFHIIEECGFLEILFPNPDYLKTSIGEWSDGMLTGWTRFWNVVNEQYDPLYNYNMNEEVKEDVSGTNTGTVSDSGTNTGTVTNAKTAYNSDAFEDAEQRTDDLHNTNTRTDDLKNTGKRVMTTKRSGNIGVTTSQQMLEAELEITRKINFYKEIARDFKEKYCVLIY